MMKGELKSCCVPARAEASRPEDALAPAVAQRGAGADAALPSLAIPVKGGKSFAGTDEPVLPQDGEGPPRAVFLKDYALEAETVTVSRFAEFVAETGYVTEAENFGWSAVFAGLLDPDAKSAGSAPETPWWLRIEGADWRHPEGPGRSIAGREDHPVTQVSWQDARRFAAWAGGRLPSEAEWEHAARGGNAKRRFAWGEVEPDDEANIVCNIWQGRFPDHNTCADGYMGTAPARSFPPSPEGFYNLCGNVWEWTADPFRLRSLSRFAKIRNAELRRGNDKVLKGGSFLCHVSYCYRYRIAARMNLTPDSAASNVGFRVAYSMPQ